MLDTLQCPCLILSGVIYGGLHALALQIPLRSKAESILWGTACIEIIYAGLIIAATSPVVQWYVKMFVSLREQPVDKSTQNVLSKLKRALQWCLTNFTLSIIVWFIVEAIASALIVLYVVGRAFLVVEVFLNVPYVDPGVYQTLNWSIYWPHIG